ncbi:hypothetical protein ACS126_19015, partial [Sphingobacterium lactis]|uniref:hypothetical protein n=1 Tax=Sphingobacterium lactis TaxID=797291 RepID=UPI003EC57DDD
MRRRATWLDKLSSSPKVNDLSPLTNAVVSGWSRTCCRKQPTRFSSTNGHSLWVSLNASNNNCLSLDGIKSSFPTAVSGDLRSCS